MKKLLCAVTVLGLATIAQAGAIRYVDDDAPLGGDGLSWATAYQSLQTAMDDLGVILVRVAQGTYELSPSGYSLVLGVAVVGGYAGIGALNPDARDLVAFETILTGSNSHRVATYSGAGTAILDGLTFEQGQSDANGGGIHNSGRLVINDCTFRNNFAQSSGDGGAIYSTGGGVLTVLNCTFLANGAIGVGGAIRSVTPAEVIGCTFDGNGSAPGGAATYGVPTIRDCVFIGNTSSAGDGGAIHTSTVVTGCTFTNNSAVRGGAAFNAANLVDCVFNENSADTGGAVSFGTNLRSCLLTNNMAVSFGGAVFGSISAISCTFSGNSSLAGGAVYGLDAEISIVNCLLSANNAVLGPEQA